MVLDRTMFQTIIILCLSFTTALSTTPYKMLSYETIYDTLLQLEIKHPNLIDVYTSQDAPFHLPSPGQCGAVECKQMYVRLTDETTLPDKDRPEVFFSGALHGNERVGPTTTLEFVRLLINHYNAATTSTRDWLTRLISKRSIWIMPSANAYGYYHNVREENHIDPNRDFPYNVQNSNNCMKTIAARSINELWISHAFQVAITFHAGQQSISSTWGGYNHPAPNDIPPDDIAQMSLIKEMSIYGAEFESNRKRYNYGRLNDNVYPVNGGMEDWAYGAAWETEAVGQGCTPTTFGGYSKQKTVYDDASIRVVNILVETSDSKSPQDSTFGTKEGVLQPSMTGGHGHVPRNVRLALLMSDLVEPYVLWYRNNYLTQQIITMSRATMLKMNSQNQNNEQLLLTEDYGHENSNAPLWLYPSLSKVTETIEWSVGGAVTVDETELMLIKWPKNKFNNLACQCVVANSDRR